MTDAFQLHSPDSISPDLHIHPDDSDPRTTQHAFTHPHHALPERNRWPSRHIYPAAESARRKAKAKAKAKDEAPQRLMLNAENNLMLDQSAHNTLL